MTDVAEENPRIHKELDSDPNKKFDAPGAPGVLRRIGDRIGTVVGAESGVEGSSLTALQVQEFRELARQCTSTEPEIAEELSTALGVAHRIRTDGHNIDLAYERLKFIFQCLTDTAPKLTLARDERLRLQLDIYKNSGPISRLLAKISSGSSAALVIAAVITSMVIWTFLVLIVRLLSDSGISSLVPDLFFMNGRVLTVVASGAFLGGVISIVSRLREFSRVSDLDPFSMFWTAMLKPLIGVVLAVFILATLAGGVITFGFLGDFMSFAQDGTSPAGHAVTERNLYILWMLAFLSGFSERFAWDFVDRAEGVTQTKSTTSTGK